MEQLIKPVPWLTDTGKEQMNSEEIRDQTIGAMQLLSEPNDAIGKLFTDPQLENFESLDSNDRPLWIVAQQEEYFITYDEAVSAYGLGFRTITGTLVYLGAEGDLADAYGALLAHDEQKDGNHKKPLQEKRAADRAQPVHYKKDGSQKNRQPRGNRKRNN